MEYEEYKKKVDERFRGLQNMVQGIEDSVYQFLYGFVSVDDIAVLEKMPGLLDALEEELGDDLLSGPPSKWYKNLSDLFELMSQAEWDCEEDDDYDESQRTRRVAEEEVYI